MDITPPQPLSPVEENEPYENGEDTGKSVNAIIAAEISVYTLAEEADEATKLEDFSSDKENSAAEKVAFVSKGEAAKASKTDTKLETFKCDQCNYTNLLKRG